MGCSEDRFPDQGMHWKQFKDYLGKEIEMKYEGKKLSLTFFGRSGSNNRVETYSGDRSCKLCSKQHGLWACSEFKELEIPKR